MRLTPTANKMVDKITRRMNVKTCRVLPLQALPCARVCHRHTYRTDTLGLGAIQRYARLVETYTTTYRTNKRNGIVMHTAAGSGSGPRDNADEQRDEDHTTEEHRRGVSKWLYYLKDVFFGLRGWRRIFRVIILATLFISLDKWVIQRLQRKGYFPTVQSITKRIKRRPKLEYTIYSDFRDKLSRGKVTSVRFDDNTPRIYYKLKNKSFGDKICYTKRIVDDQTLVPTLMKKKIAFGSRSSLSGGLSRVVLTALALWLPLIPLFLFVRRTMNQQSGAEKISKSKTKKKGGKNMDIPVTKFKDVAGVDHAIEELEEVVDFLTNAENYTKVKAKMPRGVLLSGPPGTGKTLLAKAVAGEAEVPFYSCSASEFVELFVGRGAARVRDLFKRARRNAPAIVFIDEIDAVGGKRGSGFNEERDQTLNQLLTELDGFETIPGVLLIAATNRPNVLDDALLRPGRISRRIQVPLPDLQGRYAIALVYLRQIPIAEETLKACSIEDIAETIAQTTPGFSGADISNVVNEAALLAARKNNSGIIITDIFDGINRTKYGIGGKPTFDLLTKMQSKYNELFNDNKVVRAQHI